MDYDSYNHIRNTMVYRFLRDYLFFSRWLAIRIILLFKKIGMVLLVTIVMAFIITIGTFTYQWLKEMNDNMERRNEVLRGELQTQSQTINYTSRNERNTIHSFSEHGLHTR